MPCPFLRAFSSRLSFCACFFALINTCLLASACLADVAPWNPDAQGQFITALCPGTNGTTWIGTEDNGVWRCDPAAPTGKQYTHYTTQDGLGDNNAYALVCDKSGRVWTGTLNHGVSVFNGKQWKTYGPLDGPLGSRVFALAVNPTDGGVWGATDAGLFRYAHSHWTYFTRADGLPSDQANALAFDAAGTLYVGTQCDGIAIASPEDGYKTWRVVPGPKTLPQTATGAGLPSALINCLLVTTTGTVYAGTTCGLAGSRDGGATWSFVRGLDWKAKLAGLLHPITPVPAVLSTDLLSEDYVTCLAEGGDGRLFVGHRQTGLEAFSVTTGKRVQSGANAAKTDSYLFSLLVSGETAWVGLYGGGLLTPDTYPDAPKLASSPIVPSLPVPAPPPTVAELNAMLRAVSAVAPDKNELAPKVMALDDDWVTQGDWLGRYGRYWACLCAMCSPQDYQWGAGWENVNYSLRIGPNAMPNDSLRYWVQWLYSKNPRVLEMPPTYLDSRIKKGLTTPDNNRRESEADDHSETYPQAVDGPHVYATVTVPAGLFYLSLYDFNKDGHDNSNRLRDYRLSVREHSEADLAGISGFEAQPELAHGRIRNFWGGVWKRFLVRGPVTLTVKVERNNSSCTILPAMMLDLVDELPPPYFGTVEAWEQAQAQPMAWPPPVTADPAAGLLAALEGVRQVNGGWWAAHSRRDSVALLRWYAARPASGRDKTYWRRLASCYYGAGLYGRWEDSLHLAGLTPARDIEHALKWDGSYDLRGQGNRVATSYLMQHPELNKQTKQATVTAVALSGKN